MRMRDIITVVESARNATPAAPTFASIAELIAWGDSIGVAADIAEGNTEIDLMQIDREDHAPKGSGAVFMHALYAFADARQKPIYLDVMGGNDQLHRYYRQFGFRFKPGSRDPDTSDVVMWRPFPARVRKPKPG